MSELALTRSRAKHPPDKVAVERQRITSKVKKSNKNRRIENMPTTRTPQEIEEIRATMAMPMSQRIVRMKAFIDALDKEAAINGTGTEEMRLSGTRLLNEEAMRLTQSTEDYGQAVRQAVGEVAGNHDEDEGWISIHDLDKDEYETELKRVLKDRGYEVD